MCQPVPRRICFADIEYLNGHSPTVVVLTWIDNADALVNDEEDMNVVSAETPDWSRERKGIFEWAPSRALIGSIRAYQHHASSRGWRAAVLRRVAVLRHRWWSIVTGADVPLNCRLGGGLQMPHPNGIVIHPDAEVGPNCLLFQQVTIGTRRGGAPIIGGHVDVGAGAKIIGRVTIGQHARIGANCVVLDDVPAGATAVGIPARICEKSLEES
jgi:serine O-acetyltransferase